MPQAPCLFGGITPLRVWITIHEPETTEDTLREVTIRVGVPGQRTITCKWALDVYTPESNVVYAVSCGLQKLEYAQEPITTALLAHHLGEAFRTYIEPF
jgi:hypothetical protein